MIVGLLPITIHVLTCLKKIYNCLGKNTDKKDTLQRTHDIFSLAPSLPLSLSLFRSFSLSLLRLKAPAQNLYRSIVPAVRVLLCR